MDFFLIILAIIVLACAAVLVAMYRAFVTRRNQMQQAFSAVDVQLKRRWELVPNLVQTVQGYASEERQILEKVIHARNAARDARSTSKERFLQEAKVGTGLKHLFVLAEKFPELKENDLFMNLQRNLLEIEPLIETARVAYNEAVTRWNEGVQTFPRNLMALWFEFERAEFFEDDESEPASGNDGQTS